jgi:tRNA 2-thiouridine synthesizing protein A
MNTMTAELTDQPTIEALLRDVDRLRDRPCAGCRRPLCGHEAVFAIALGFKDAPRCLACLAGGLGRDPDTLRDDAYRHVVGRDCFRAAWHEAGRREGRDAERPSCLWPGGVPHVARNADSHISGAMPTAATPTARDADWDAGDMACGDLVLALRLRLTALPARAVLRLVASDPAAPQDLPAWCRLTGHRLLHADHPVYFIERRES